MAEETDSDAWAKQYPKLHIAKVNIKRMHKRFSNAREFLNIKNAIKLTASKKAVKWKKDSVILKILF
jgi:hypothetical protein